MSGGVRRAPSTRSGAQTLVRVVAVVMIALAVTACGFHLRGSSSLPEGLMPIHIDAPGNSGMGAALREALQRQDAELTDDRSEARSSLAVLDEGEDRRVLSVDDTVDVSEYEVRKTVRWQLVRPVSGEDQGGDGDDAKEGVRTLIAPNQLQARRDYEFDSSQVLSKAEEERTLYKNMEQALAQQILARLQAWSPEGE